MTHLQGPPAELHFTLQITRAATGLTETIDMVGHVIPPADDAAPQADAAQAAAPQVQPEETPA